MRKLGFLIAVPFLSWVLIHGLSIFGVFLAVAYPLWWLIIPNKTVCLLCQAEKEGSKCPLCRKNIIKNEKSPKNFTSALLNGVLILSFTIISILIVFFESQLFFKSGFPLVPKTASFIIPPKSQYRLGEIFPMKIEINNIKTPINAIQSDIGFDPDKLEIVEISTNDSFADVFIQKEINNQGGWARLTGGLPNPGWIGNHGIFGTVFFKGKSPGLVKISFLPSSMILANDGKGTNILKDLPAFSYLILPERISKDEEKEQRKLLSSNVLEKSIDKNQLVFYEDKAVLGAEAKRDIDKASRPSLKKLLLDSLEKIDRATLSFWWESLGILSRI